MVLDITARTAHDHYCPTFSAPHPIRYVDFRQQRTARDEQGQPIRDQEGRPKLEWVQRDRPLVKLHHVFNVEQTEGLKLRSLETAAPEWDGHERAEALINACGVGSTTLPATGRTTA